MDTDDVLELMKRVADEVVRPRFRRLDRSEIFEKGPGDYVTVADREAETLLTAALLAAYPDAAVIGEEAVADNPQLLVGIEAHEHAFVVDPVDGTGNFVRGNPDYAVMIGELRRGEAVRGWIWQPERGIGLVGEHGGGVFRDGVLVQPIDRGTAVRGRSPIKKFIGLDSPALAEPIGPSWSCAGVDYVHLIGGVTDFVCFKPPKPWDHVPGALMLRELGGVARLADGTPYGPEARSGNLIVAATDKAWEAARDVVAARLA